MFALLTAKDAHAVFASRVGRCEAVIAQCRIDLDCARLLVLRCAAAIDAAGARAARQQIAMIKICVPNAVLRVLDQAIQVHGGLGVCQDTDLARAYAHIRTLRLADGPDDVHISTVAKLELLARAKATGRAAKL